jgi:hypothetical protein
MHPEIRQDQLQLRGRAALMYPFHYDCEALVAATPRPCSIFWTILTACRA